MDEAAKSRNLTKDQRTGLVGKLRERIRSGAYTYADAASALGVTEAAVRKWTAKKLCPISAGYAERLVRFLG